MSRLKKILRWLIVAVCLFYLLRFFHNNWSTLKIAFTLKTSTIIYIITLQVISHLLISLRFRIILEKCSNRKIRFFYWFKLYILGRFLSTMISQAGNIYRSVHLKQDCGISYTQYIGSYTSFVWMDTFINFFIAAIAIAVRDPAYKLGQFFMWKMLLFLSLALLAFPITIELFFRKISFTNKRMKWMHSKLHEVLTASVNNIRDPLFMLKVILLGLAVFTRTCLSFYIYFSIFNIHATIPLLVVFCALSNISTFIVLTPGNLGIQELAYGFLAQTMGIGMAQGVLISMLARAFVTTYILALGAVFGGVDLFRKRNDYRTPSK